MLQNNKIYFLSPLQFNDPFDCRAHEYIFESINENSLKLFSEAHEIPANKITEEKIKLISYWG